MDLVTGVLQRLESRSAGQEARHPGEHNQDVVAPQLARNPRMHGCLISEEALVAMYDEDQGTLAAEYVLGTLSSEERRQAGVLRAFDVKFESSVQQWERGLGELNIMV